jgi:formylmethanofuran dehydrogenase subunit E
MTVPTILTPMNSLHNNYLKDFGGITAFHGHVCPGSAWDLKLRLSALKNLNHLNLRTNKCSHCRN